MSTQSARFGSPTIPAERWAQVNWDSPAMRELLRAVDAGEHYCVAIRMVPTGSSCIALAVHCACGYEVGFGDGLGLRIGRDGRPHYRKPNKRPLLRAWEAAQRHYEKVATVETTPLTDQERKQLATLRRRELAASVSSKTLDV